MSRSDQSDSDIDRPQPQIPTTHRLLQYKNGMFQGNATESNQRHGKGIYIWTTGEVYYGNWAHDSMEGEGIFYFALGGYVYGTFLNSKVHGYAILYFLDGDYLAGFWNEGILTGKVIQHSRENDEWVLHEYKNGAASRTLSKGKGSPPLSSFSMLETSNLKKLLDKELSIFNEDATDNSQKNMEYLPMEPIGWYHGNTRAKQPHGLGVVCYAENRSDRGQYKKGDMNGPGRSIFPNGDVYEGFYKDGKFSGPGVYFKSETDQFLYGTYEENECAQPITLGEGYPHDLMRDIKSDFELDNAKIIDQDTEAEVLKLFSQAEAQQNEKEAAQTQQEQYVKKEILNVHETQNTEEKKNDSEEYDDEDEDSEIEEDHDEETNGEFLKELESMGGGTPATIDNSRPVEPNKANIKEVPQKSTFMPQKSSSLEQTPKENNNPSQPKDSSSAYSSFGGKVVESRNVVYFEGEEDENGKKWTSVQRAVSKPASSKDGSSQSIRESDQIKDVRDSKNYESNQKPIRMSEIKEKLTNSKEETESDRHISARNSIPDTFVSGRVERNVNPTSVSDVSSVSINNSKKDPIFRSYKEAAQAYYESRSSIQKTEESEFSPTPSKEVRWTEEEEGRIDNICTRIRNKNEMKGLEQNSFTSDASKGSDLQRKLKTSTVSRESNDEGSFQNPVKLSSGSLKTNSITRDETIEIKPSSKRGLEGASQNPAKLSSGSVKANSITRDETVELKSSVKKGPEGAFQKLSSGSMKANSITRDEPEEVKSSGKKGPAAQGKYKERAGSEKILIINEQAEPSRQSRLITHSSLDTQGSEKEGRSHIKADIQKIMNEVLNNSRSSSRTRTDSPEFGVSEGSFTKTPKIADLEFAKPVTPNPALQQAMSAHIQSLANPKKVPEIPIRPLEAGYTSNHTQKTSGTPSLETSVIHEQKEGPKIFHGGSFGSVSNLGLENSLTQRTSSGQQTFRNGQTLEAPAQQEIQRSNVVNSRVLSDGPKYSLPIDIVNRKTAEQQISSRSQEQASPEFINTRQRIGENGGFPSTGAFSPSDNHSLSRNKQDGSPHRSGLKTAQITEESFKNGDVSPRLETGSNRLDTFSNRLDTGSMRIDTGSNESYTCSERSASLSTSQILRKYGLDTYQENQASRPDLMKKLIVPIEENRRASIVFMKKKDPKEKTFSEVSSQVLPEKEAQKLEDELYKIIVLKLDLLVKEQNKMTEAVEGVKNALNEKIDILFKGDQKEKETYKSEFTGIIDTMLKQRTRDMTLDQILNMHHEMKEHYKQVDTKVSGLNTKLDWLLERQAQLNNGPIIINSVQKSPDYAVDHSDASLNRIKDVIFKLEEQDRDLNKKLAMCGPAPLQSYNNSSTLTSYSGEKPVMSVPVPIQNYNNYSPITQYGGEKPVMCAPAPTQNYNNISPLTQYGGEKPVMSAPTPTQNYNNGPSLTQHDLRIAGIKQAVSEFRENDRKLSEKLDSARTADSRILTERVEQRKVVKTLTPQKNQLFYRGGGVEAPAMRLPNAGSNVLLVGSIENIEESNTRKTLTVPMNDYRNLSSGRKESHRDEFDRADTSDYNSVTADTLPPKAVKTLHPRSSEFSIKNDHTLHLLEYESRLRRSQPDPMHTRTHSQDHEVYHVTSISVQKSPTVQRSHTPTPQQTQLTQPAQPRSPFNGPNRSPVNNPQSRTPRGIFDRSIFECYPVIPTETSSYSIQEIPSHRDMGQTVHRHSRSPVGERSVSHAVNPGRREQHTHHSTSVSMSYAPHSPEHVRRSPHHQQYHGITTPKGSLHPHVQEMHRQITLREIHSATKAELSWINGPKMMSSGKKNMSHHKNAGYQEIELYEDERGHYVEQPKNAGRIDPKIITRTRETQHTVMDESQVYHHSPLRSRKEPVSPRYHGHDGNMGTVRRRIEVDETSDFLGSPLDASMRRGGNNGNIREVTERYSQETQKSRGSHHETEVSSRRDMRMNAGGHGHGIREYRDVSGEREYVTVCDVSPPHDHQRRVYKMSDQAKHNFIVDTRTPTLSMTSELLAKNAHYHDGTVRGSYGNDNLNYSVHKTYLGGDQDTSMKRTTTSHLY